MHVATGIFFFHLCFALDREFGRALAGEFPEGRDSDLLRHPGRLARHRDPGDGDHTSQH